jgi:hypothetical protein
MLGLSRIGWPPMANLAEPLLRRIRPGPGLGQRQEKYQVR